MLFGNPQDQINFVKTVNIYFYTDFIWFTQDLTNSMVDSAFSDVYQDIILFNYQITMRQLIIENRDNFNQRKYHLQKYHVQNGSTTEMTYALFERIFNFLCKRSKQNFLNTRAAINLLFINTGNILIRKGYRDAFKHLIRFYDEKMLVKDLRGKVGAEFREFSEKTICKAYICPQEWEQSRGELLKQFTKWNFEYGFTCKQCQHNFVKPTKGNKNACRKCPRYYLSNENHTMCLDPYREQFLTTDTIYFTAFVLSCCNITICAFTLIVFMKYPNTPIVKSSDFLLAMIHMFTSILINAAFSALRHLKPREWTCFLDAIFAGTVDAL